MASYKELHNLEDDPPQYAEKEEWIVKTSVQSRSQVWVKVLIAIVTSLVLAGVVMVTMHFFMKTVFSDNRQFKDFLDRLGAKHSMESMDHHPSMMVSDDDQDSVMLGVTEHYVATSEEKLWVVKDLAAGVQILKSQTSYGSVCYVSKLPEKEYLRSKRQAEDEADKEKAKEYVSMVYVTLDDEPIQDLSVLGRRGKELCSGVPTVWISPSTEHQTDDDDDDIQDVKVKYNMTETMGGWKETNNHGIGRSKRNIRQCRTSCCWLVCCCDVHHFVWETVEEFTCVHVCHGCTSKYQSKIVKIC